MSSGVIQELRTVVFGRASIADGILPPVVFAVADATAGTVTAAVLAVVTGLAIVTVRLRSGRPVKFALAGLGGVTVAAVAALGLGPGGFFLPSVVSGAGLTMLIIISIGLGRPFVAWTSWLARSWPLAWYWHPRVRPAYTFVSWIWAGFFGAAHGRAVADARVDVDGSVVPGHDRLACPPSAAGRHLRHR